VITEKLVMVEELEDVGSHIGRMFGAVLSMVARMHF